MKKPVLNPNLTLTLMLGLPAKHSDVFHCLYKGKFLVKLGLARLCRDTRFAHSNPSSPQTHQKLTQLVCLIL